MCTFNGSAVELYSAGYLAWLAGPLLYFAVAIFGIVQLVIHFCNADKVIRHYVVMLSLFVLSLVLRGAWFMLTCPTPKSDNGTTPEATDFETYFKAADEAGWRIDDYDDAMIQLMGGTEFTAYQAGIKVGWLLFTPDLNGLRLGHASTSTSQINSVFVAVVAVVAVGVVARSCPRLAFCCTSPLSRCMCICGRK